MKRLKSFLAFSCIIAILVSFSGCSFRFSSFDNLLRPPKLSGVCRIRLKSSSIKITAFPPLKTDYIALRLL